MPGIDGSGPTGSGPMTGRVLGRGLGRGRAHRFGMRRSFSRGVGRGQKELLQVQRDMLKKRLDEIGAELEDL